MSKISKERAAEVREEIRLREAEIKALRGQLGGPLSVAEIRKLTPDEARERWEEIRGRLPDSASERPRPAPAP